MDIHEFQTKDILQQYGIPIPEYAAIKSLEELESLIAEKSWQSGVIKAQIHAGGRGKGGGVQLARSPSDMLQAAEKLLGKKLKTPQTHSEGLIVHTLLVSPLIDIKREFYLSLTIDREKGQIVLLASPEGGVEIEEVAHKHPDKLLKIALPQEGRFRSYHLIRIAHFMGWQNGLEKQGKGVINALVKAFQDTDATLIEVNPLVETQEGRLFALDAKMVIDDNALFRHPEIKALFDPTQVAPSEAMAQKYDLAYVSLDGNIGCMVNGAGLAMSTMDLIHHFGGRPANFLDVGGSATEEKVAEGFKMILTDKNVKAILVNIFGGIMNCKTIASGIISAVKDLHLHIPLVVRLEGTDVEHGRELLRHSGLNIVAVDDFNESAQKVVSLVGTDSSPSRSKGK
jgi:succinyl-CoA synthetase beta subunit